MLCDEYDHYAFSLLKFFEQEREPQKEQIVQMLMQFEKESIGIETDTMTKIEVANSLLKVLTRNP